MTKIAVIGGGITGLAAALTLEEKGVDYLLFEQSERLGGKILTERQDGFLVEGGPDCYIADKPWLTELSQRIGLGESLIGTNDQFKGTYVYSGGRMHTLPEGLMMMVPTKILPFAFSPLISWPGKFRMAGDFFLPRRREEGDETLKNFVLRRMGREALDKVAEPLIGGIHGGDPETMSLLASFPRFLTMEKEHGSLIRGMLAARRRSKGKPVGVRKGPRTYFISFRQGMGELVEGIRAQLRGPVITGSQVISVLPRQAGYSIRTQEGEWLVDGVILAIPAPEAAQLLEPLDTEAAQCLSAIPMASSASASLAFKRDQVPGIKDSFGFVIPFAEGRKINAVTYSSIKWDYRVPGDEFVLIRTFIGGAKNSHLAKMDEDHILAMILAELQSILGINVPPVMTKVHRWLDSRPQYTIGHLDRIQCLEERLSHFPGLYVAGGSYRGIGVPDCVRDGTRAAESACRLLTDAGN